MGFSLQFVHEDGRSYAALKIRTWMRNLGHEIFRTIYGP